MLNRSGLGVQRFDSEWHEEQTGEICELLHLAFRPGQMTPCLMTRPAQSRKPLKLDPERSLGYQVRRCHRRFDRLLANYLARHGLKVGFWYYLRVLWIRDGVTQKFLSDATNVTENTTATLINGMIKAGLVTRERDPDDSRKMCIRLAPKGRQLEGQLMGYAIEINKVAIKGIAPQDAEICASVLRRISTNLQTEFDKVAAR